MSNTTDDQESDFLHRDQIRDAIVFLSRLELNLDKINKSDKDAPLNARIKNNPPTENSLMAKSHLTSFFWNFLANFLTVIVAVIAAWVFIGANYASERSASSPMLSVQYAYFHEVGSVKKEPIARIMHQISQFDGYGEFVMSSMGRHDLRHVDAMSADIGASDAKKLENIVSMYRNFLIDEKSQLAQQKTSIPVMQVSELRMQGRSRLEGIDGLNNDEIREELVKQIQADIGDINDLLVALDSVDRLLAQIESRVFVKLSILNTGGRTGLVRPRGFIEYADTCYAMLRVEAPPQDERPIAVPTYVTNSEVGSVVQTVGKIDSDTMVEYWYEVRGSMINVLSCAGLKEEASIAETNERQGCPSGHEAIVYLFNHEKRPILRNIECNGPLS